MRALLAALFLRTRASRPTVLSDMHRSAADAILCTSLLPRRPCSTDSDWIAACLGSQPLFPKSEEHARKAVRWAMSTASPRIVLGNGGARANVTRLYRWGSIESEKGLDMGDPCAWARVFFPSGRLRAPLVALLTEHVMEHMTPISVLTAAAAAFHVLRPGGRFRNAMPDGYNPSNSNRLGTNDIKGSAPHRIMWTHSTLGEVLARAGFEVMEQEWHTVDGRFHQRPWWESAQTFGHVRRSLGNRSRDRDGSQHKKKKTRGGHSLIMDAIKPAADTRQSPHNGLRKPVKAL